jgi:hypothetical protein
MGIGSAEADGGGERMARWRTLNPRGGKRPIAGALKHVDLMLEENLIERLQEERVSMSELVSSLLCQDLGMQRDVQATVERIRLLRKTVGPMTDSTPAIRESRDRGW